MVSVWMIIVCGILITPLVSCGTPSFAIRVDVEPFNSTTVGSQIVYQCQSGLLPEGRMTSVCRGDGRWNPDPATLLCEGKTHVCSLVGITKQTNIDDMNTYT